MANKPIQEVIHKKVITLTILIADYFKTFLAVLVHPKVTYDELSMEGNRSELMKPGAFLIANILIFHSIDYFFGYNIPKFPFKTLVPNPFGNFPFLILRYIIGTLLFLTILKLFIKQYKLVEFIYKTFPVICYASAIYIPYVFIHGLSGAQVGEYLFNSYPHVMQNICEKTFLVFSLKILFFLLIPQFVFIVWWLWIVYLGLKSTNISPSIKLKKAIIISPIIFIIIELSTMLTASYIMNASTLGALKIVYSGSIDEIMAQESPNYFEAMFIAESVSDNKQMPEYGRYAYKLIKMSSAIAIPTFRNDKTVIAEILKGIKSHDYKYVETIISTHIDSLSANIDLKKELKEVVELRNSPSFIDLKGMTVTLITKYVDELETSSPDLIRVDEKNYIYVCPIAVSPALISIFP